VKKSDKTTKLIRGERDVKKSSCSVKLHIIGGGKRSWSRGVLGLEGVGERGKLEGLRKSSDKPKHDCKKGGPDISPPVLRTSQKGPWKRENLQTTKLGSVFTRGSLLCRHRGEGRLAAKSKTMEFKKWGGMETWMGPHPCRKGQILLGIRDDHEDQERRIYSPTETCGEDMSLNL